MSTGALSPPLTCSVRTQGRVLCDLPSQLIVPMAHDWLGTASSPCPVKTGGRVSGVPGAVWFLLTLSDPGQGSCDGCVPPAAQ